MDYLWTFWFPCFLMGFGIAVDVIIATVSQFRNQSLSVKSWSLPIAGTHILFPAFGYYGVWGLLKFFETTDIVFLGLELSLLAPYMSFLLGLVGFVLVALFVYEVFCETADIEPFFAISEWFSELVGLDKDDARLFIAILAVSWDALWSGPAKAATTEGWSNTEVFWSFFVAGAAVFIFAQVALFIALQMRKAEFHNVIGMSRFTFWGKLTELSVIGGFGVLSLWSGIYGEGNIYSSIAIAAGIMSFLFFVYGGRIAANEQDEAEEAVSA